MKIRRWRWVVGFRGLYQVSDDGLVRSKDRHALAAYGKPRWFRGRVLRQRLVSGYPSVCLQDRAGGRKACWCRVHLLVLEAFVSARPFGMYGCHKNDVRTDNKLSNLKWDTPSGNQRDRYANGHGGSKERIPRGANQHLAKLTARRVSEIRWRFSRGLASQSELAREFRVSQASISAAILRKTWRHVA